MSVSERIHIYLCIYI